MSLKVVAGMICILAILVVVAWDNFAPTQSLQDDLGLRKSSDEIGRSSALDASASISLDELPATSLPPEKWAISALRAKSVFNDPVNLEQSPLLGRLSELKRQALAGDVRAALQLSLELTRCGEKSTLLTAAESASARGGVIDLDTASESLRLADELEVICAGISHEEISASYKWLELAANMGDARSAMLYLAKGSPLIEDAAAAFRDPEELARFKAKGREFLRRAARDCYVEALYEMSEAYASGSWFTRNEQYAQAYAILADRVVGAVMETTPSSPRIVRQEGEWERAELIAARLYLRDCQ